MFFLLLRFSISLVAGISSSDSTLAYILYVFAILFLGSLILVYKNNIIGSYLFFIVAAIELLLNIENVTYIECLPFILFFGVFGIYLAYKTYLEIRDAKKTQIE